MNGACFYQGMVVPFSPDESLVDQTLDDPGDATVTDRNVVWCSVRKSKNDGGEVSTHLTPSLCRSS